MAHHPVEDSNTSDNPSLESIVGARLSRRDVLRGSASAATIALLGGVGLAACDGDDDDGVVGVGDDGGGTNITQNPQSLGFTPVPKSLEDFVVVPPGYQAEILIAKGDPIVPGIAPFSNDGTDVDYEQRSGDEHDGMHLFMMNASGEFDPEATDRGILLTNHENLEDATIHESVAPPPPRDPAVARLKKEVDREMNLHGVSCVEIRKVAGSTGRWEYLQDSTFNRRVTAFTEMEITGPARGADFMKTRTDPDGTTRLGTLNNCAHGFTPWGTYLACEENWFSYFNRGDDQAQRDPADNDRLARYGMGPDSQGFSYRAWDTVAGDTYERFKITAATGGSATDDFRNEPNRFGYLTEIDPFRPGQKPKVRTAFGRMAHEGAWPAAFVAGQPLVYYMGDDARSEYIYKYVSNANWDPADANLGLAAGDKYLDDGTLYVAVFNEDGSGEWRELSGAALAGFSDAEVAAFTREAADSVNATKMDRPEWATVNPFNGDVYLCMTNNRARNSRFDGTNAANPRFFVDDVAPVDDSNAGNAFGHIIRWREANDDPAATSFAWDIFLFAAEAGADPNNINISGLSEDNDFASPDGLHFDARGVMWIQTDGGDLRSETNNMMLAALPNLASRSGEGQALTVTATVDDTESGSGITAGVSQQTTQVALRDAASVDLRRFLVGAVGCEITGIIVTPDARTLFCNVQHPGEGGDPAVFNSDVSTWPAASGDATQPGEPGRRTRSATIMVYREDGGEIAL